MIASISYSGCPLIRSGGGQIKFSLVCLKGDRRVARKMGCMRQFSGRDKQ